MDKQLKKGMIASELIIVAMEMKGKRPTQLNFEELIDVVERVVKNCNIADVVGQSEQLSQENDKLKKACQDFINSVELKQLLRQG